MKNLLIISTLFVSLWINAQKEFSVMTYNIRLDVASDGENAWDNRKDFFITQIQFYEPDIFGVQEALPHQVNYIKNHLKEYHFIGIGRDGGNKGEYSAIFYNSKRFELLTDNTFWLSGTPEKVSKGWDAAHIRVCTYGLFKDKKTKKKFWMFNTHLDNEGINARNNGMKLILKKISEINKKNYPVILTGDFNDVPESEMIINLKNTMNDTREHSKATPFGPYGTFTGFKFHEPVKNRIDYIFVSKSSKTDILKYAVLTDSKDMKYPSDHFPVYVQLQLTN